MTAPAATRCGFGHAVIHRILHLYFLMVRSLKVGVRAIVRSDDGRFLLVRHTYMPGWHFPGGGVERGQSTEHALRNELLQETGLRLIGKPVLHGVFQNRKISKRDHVLTYLCEVDTNAPGTPSSLEIAEIGYFDIKDLPDGVEPGTLRRMKEISRAPPRPGAGDLRAARRPRVQIAGSYFAPV